MANIFHKCCGIHLLAYILVIIGALNWGLVALGGYTDTNLNIVNLALGAWPMLEWGVYLLVGISAVVMLFQSSCSMCDERHF